ncbi:MAG: AraC family transcriptional regulator, partial [Planctomycetota bacterium]
VHRVIDYVIDHLDQPPSLAEAAEIAHFSPHHFHRIFKSIAGETLADFVRRVRIERSAHHLRHGTGESLLEVALRFGFQSASDFSRVFKKRFGLPPRDFQQLERAEVRKICQAADETLDYDRFQLNEEFDDDAYAVNWFDEPDRTIAYVRVVDPTTGSRLADGFTQLREWAQAHGLWEGGTLMGMSLEDPDITPSHLYRYDVALTVPDGTPASDGVTTRRWHGAKYASIRCRGGMTEVIRVWDFLCKHWLLRSQWQPDDRPAIEVYHDDPFATPLPEGEPLPVSFTWNFDARIPVVPL